MLNAVVYPTRNDRMLKDFKVSLELRDLNPQEEDFADKLAAKALSMAELIIMNLPDSEKRSRVLETLSDTCFKAQRLIRMDP